MIFRRILCGDYHKRLGERIGLVIDGNLGLTHRLQQAALGFWSGAVDFVSQHDVCEQGPRHELKRLLLPIEDRDSHDIRGQKVARELDPFE
ncbi:MAG: hypothetical protein U0361_11770 [Nitrospiraceae bacterium]